jgi:hypothetical protein
MGPAMPGAAAALAAAPVRGPQTLMHPLLVALVALVAVGRAPVAAKQPPNIVLMLIDDCKPDLVVVLVVVIENSPCQALTPLPHAA